ncbi:MAG: type II toxin-antitoxin system VapC family toxin [Candidatus Binataceae bacterium]
MAQTIIHLDTSFLIRALRRGSVEDRELHRWLAAKAELAVSAVAWSEFLCGPLDARQLELANAIVGNPVPFAGEDARIAAELFNGSGRRRGSFVDCMIAAAAIRAEASLATANRADFQKFVNLRLA